MKIPEQPPVDRPFPDSARQRGLKCPTCGGGTLRTRNTLNVGDHSRVRRAQCMNPRCSAIHAVVQVVVEGPSAHTLAKEMAEGRVRVDVVRRAWADGADEKLNVRL